MASSNDPRVRASTVSTGTWIAAARALETARPDRLFNDPWAGLLAGESGKATLDAAAYNPFLPVRTRYFDDRILGFVEDGTQIVLLGAGLDTRAFRLPLPASCTVFEVDYAEAFEQKESILRNALSRCERRCVRTDLSGAWIQTLLDAGFDRRAASIWVAEGLFFYLAVSDVESLVRDAAALSCQGSAFLADVFGTGLLTLESMVPMVAQRRSAGRPLPFCTDLPEALFLAGGWSKASVVQPGESAANYGRLTRVPRAGETAGQGQDNLRTYLVTAVL